MEGNPRQKTRAKFQRAFPEPPPAVIRTASIIPNDSDGLFKEFGQVPPPGHLKESGSLAGTWEERWRMNHRKPPAKGNHRKRPANGVFETNWLSQPMPLWTKQSFGIGRHLS